MNRSHITLLAALLFIAPYAFAEDTTPNTNAEALKPAETNQNLDKPADQSQQTLNKPTDQNPIIPLTNPVEKPVVQPGTLEKLGVFVATSPVFVATNTGDVANWFADKTYFNTVVSKITATKYLKETRLNNPENIKLFGQIVVLGLAGLGVYKLYTTYNAQDDADEDITFDDEEYEDNN